MTWSLVFAGADDAEAVRGTMLTSDGFCRVKDFHDHSGMTMTWGTADEDMLALSRRFPSVLFVLTVINAEEPYLVTGSSPPERWFYRGGQSYKSKAQVIFDAFDASKLA